MKLDWNHFKKGRKIDGPKLGTRNGLTIVSGVKVPQSTHEKFATIGSFDFVRVAKVEIVKKAQWQEFRFVDCDFSDVGFMGVTIQNCEFESTKLEDIGFWTSKVTDCTFRNCNLKRAAFGGKGLFNSSKSNVFSNVEFENCDLRETGHSIEIYESCRFINCKFDSEDFLGAIFRKCKFVGSLENVIFRDHDPTSRSNLKNRLEQCDFSESDVSGCLFIGIDLDPSIFGGDGDMIVVPNGPDDWLAWLKWFDGRINEGGKWFITEMANDSGTPSITSRRFLLEAFSPVEVEAFEVICGTSAIS